MTQNNLGSALQNLGTRSGRRRPRVSLLNKSWPPTRALWRPLLEGSPQLSELIEEALDLELEVSVVSGGVVKLVVFLPLVGVGELQTATLSLVADRVWEGANAREVKAVHRRVAGASVPGEEKPRLFLLLAGVEELENGV